MECPEPLSEHLEPWLPGGELPLVIAGPCSAESPEQLLSTAHALALIPQVRIFRAGLWKPRTRPDGFQGVGAEGLAWMQAVKAETGLLLTVEVARPAHVEEALKAGIDILWIGARTSGNPFSMQEIAEAVQDTDIPVMVKNPLNPDLKLWLGALERLSQAGIRRLAAIHRGFYPYTSSRFRHDPMWEVPIELKRHCPNLPIICDPSHISGNTALIQGVSQKALDLAMDGLMIEVHHNPAAALTDKKQQLHPSQLSEILGQLVVRRQGNEPGLQDMLAELRNQIDSLDHELIRILDRRMEIVRRIGDFKRDHGMTVLQIRRWMEIIEDRIGRGEQAGLEREFLLKLLQLIHKEAIRIQTEAMEGGYED